MILTWQDMSVIGLYLVGLVIFGVFIRRIRGFEDFSVARREVPAPMVFAALCGAYLGPGFSLGLTGKAYQGGYLMPAVFTLFAVQTIIVGVWVAPRLKRVKDAHTLGDIMGRFYGREAQFVTGIVSVGLCIGFAGVLARAGGSVLAPALGISVPKAILIVAGVGTLYTITGGLKSVIATDAFQFSIVLCATGLTLLLAGDRAGSFHALDVEAANLTRAAWASTSASSLFGLCVLTLLGECLIPPYSNRALAAGSEGASRRGFVAAGGFSVAWFGMMAAAGVIARHVLPPNSDADGALVSLAGVVLPHGLLGLFLVAIAAMVMSTQEGLLNAASVCLAQDLLGFSRSWRDHTRLTLARGATFLFGCVAVGFALKAPSIISGLLVCYSIWAPTVLPALIWALAGLPTPKWSGVLSTVFGGSVTAVIVLGKLGGGDPTRAVLVGFAASAFGFLVGFMLRPQLRRAV
jgi:SSS family solute:Na+ symporter